MRTAKVISAMLPAALLAVSVGVAQAKLPAAPPKDPAEVAAAKKKAAEGANKAAGQLAKAQDRAAERYKREKGGAKPAAAKK